MHKKTRNNCLIAILEGDVHDVHQSCQFRVIHSLPEPAIFQLSSSQVFITRIPTISVTCNNTVTEVKTPQIQVVRSRVFEAADRTIANVQTDCYDFGRPDFTFPVNLKIIYHFFQVPSISEWGLSADTLVDHHIDIVIPKLLIQHQRVIDNLAIQDALQFDLNAIINKSRDDIKSYASLSHVLLDSLETTEKTPLVQSQWLT